MAPAEEARARLAALLSDHPELSASLDLVWQQALRAFPAADLDRWLALCRALAAQGLGEAVVLAYLRNGPVSSALLGPPAALALGHAALAVGEKAGPLAARTLLNVGPVASRRLQSQAGLREWLRIVAQVAELAPESLTLLLERSERLLSQLDLRAYEAWVLAGIRATAGDPARRLRYFTLQEAQAQDWLEREAGAVTFTAMERRLRAYLTALWGLRPSLRAARGQGGQPQRRATFEGPLLRLPESFGGVAEAQGRQLYRASVAHLAAHLLHSRQKFTLGTLKPLQVALVSLIEDARVEQLALRQHPGLRRLWLPFHQAAAGGTVTAPGLMARLARALLDPDYRDADAWVAKGRALFFAAEAEWDSPAVSRRIGNLLGNDLGQMRIQFNARTYVVEPPYRDDNRGLWDFGDAGASLLDAELLFESLRIERGEEGGDSQRQEAQPAEGAGHNRAREVASDEEAGLAVARYPEWDYLIGHERADWTTVQEFPAVPGPAGGIERILERRAALVGRITALIRQAKVSRADRLKRQPEGDRLDLDACIGAAIDRRLGLTPDPRVYALLRQRRRDLSVLVLLDVSQSTQDVVPAAGESILALEREATALLAHAMAELGDPFAIHAFCSNGREEVRYQRIKDFPHPYDAAARRRLGGLSSGLSTRMGTALRHGGSLLAGQRTYRRLLLVVTDGEPSDIDVGDRRYLVEDARKAVMTLTHQGVDVFCVGLDAGGDSYLARIFGRRNVVQIDRIEHLPERLPLLYLRLTA